MSKKNKQQFTNSTLNEIITDNAAVKVSVVIPVYRVEDYIERCLDSLQNQTLQEIEFIFVDDCGGDNSIKFVEERAKTDNRIKIIYNEKNLGEGATRNRGIKAARGEYIGFVDSDDTVDTDFFEKLYQMTEKYDCDIVKGERIVYTLDGEEEKGRLSEKLRRFPEYSERDDWMLYFTYEHTTAIYKTALILEHGIKYGQMTVDGDTFWLLQICTYAKKAAFCYGTFYHYFKRENSSSTTYSKDYFDAKILGLKAKIDFMNTSSIPEDICCEYLSNLFGSSLLHYKNCLKEYYFTDHGVCDDFLKKLRETLISFKNQYAFKIKMSENQRLYSMYDEIMEESPLLKRKPVISVIIPFFNEEKYLGGCLDSLIKQNYKYFEIICIDDGSTDMSSDVVFEYMTRTLKIKYYKQENKGAGAARNIGITYSRGEYLLFMDSDDYCYSVMLDTAYKKALESGSDITVFGSRIQDVETKAISECTWAFKKQNFPDYEPFCFADIINNPFISFTWRAWDKLFKKSFVLEEHLQFQEQRTANDIFFVLSAFLRGGKVSVVTKPLYIQRRNIPTSLQSTRELSYDCFYTALLKIKAELVSLGLYEKYRYYFINFALGQCVWTLTTIKESAAKKLLIKFRTGWFEELEILDYGQEFYESPSNYMYFRDIIYSEEYTNSEQTLWQNFRNRVLERENLALTSPTRIIKVSENESLPLRDVIKKLQWARREKVRLENELNNPDRRIKIDEGHSLSQGELVQKLVWNREQNEILRNQVNELSSPERKIRIDKKHSLTEKDLVQKLIWNRTKNEELKKRISELETELDPRNHKIAINSDERLTEEKLVGKLLYNRQLVEKLREQLAVETDPNQHLVKVSDTETLTETRLVGKLLYNRELADKLKAQLAAETDPEQHKVKLSGKETITEKQLINDLANNRELVSKLEKQLKTALNPNLHKVKVSDKETLSETQIVSKLSYNREKSSRLENELRTLNDKNSTLSAKCSDLEKQLAAARAELENIQKSKSFKIGRFVTFIPRKLGGSSKK